MKIVEVRDLPIEGLKTIKYEHFRDNRGYFTETLRYDDVDKALGLQHAPFAQCNESYSKAMTVRGLHFQWNPYMGKLVRTIQGHMVDIALDIRKGSPTLGKGYLFSLAAHPSRQTNDWVWVPPGFAHGCVFLSDSTIEYMCTGFWNPECEASISPLAEDIDWSLCDESLSKSVRHIIETTYLMTAKDRNGLTVQGWLDDERSSKFWLEK